MKQGDEHTIWMKMKNKNNKYIKIIIKFNKNIFEKQNNFIKNYFGQTALTLQYMAPMGSGYLSILSFRVF